MSEKVLSRLQERFGDAVLATSSYRGDEAAVVTRARFVEVLRFLKEDPALLFDMPTDLTAIDWLGVEGRADDAARFEVVIHLYSTTLKHRVRIKSPVPESDCTIPSSTAVYPGMRWAEREAWDMYGIKFVGNADQRRLFMYESFQGHPLRKDFPKEFRQPLARRERND